VTWSSPQQQVGHPGFSIRKSGARSFGPWQLAFQVFPEAESGSRKASVRWPLPDPPPGCDNSRKRNTKQSLPAGRPRELLFHRHGK